LVIAVINNKGGTGKTTTSVNMSAALAALDFRVLLVDLDSQANASLSLGIPYSELSPSISETLFNGTPAESVIRNTNIPQLDLITGGPELANSDLIMGDMPGRENLLAGSLKPVKELYDFIICDCPPSMSLLSVNALVAAAGYIVPIIPEYLSLEGLVTLLSAVEKIEKGMGLDMNLLGILFTMVNPDRLALNRRELKIQLKIIKLVREYYGDDVFKTFIIRDVRLSETTSYGQSIFEFAPKSRAAILHNRLTREMLTRCRIVLKS
jgi:chromosome partitioning protein